MSTETGNQHIIVEGDEGLDIKKIWYSLMKHWYWFLVMPIIMGALGYFYIRYTNPEFKVQGTILIKNEDSKGLSQEALGEQLMGLGIGGFSSEIADEVRVIKSRTMMLQIIKNLGLDHKVISEGRIKNSDLYGESPILVDSFGISQEHIRKNGNMPVIGNLVVQEDLSSYKISINEKEYNGLFNRCLHIDSVITMCLRYAPAALANANEMRTFKVIFSTKQRALEENINLMDIAFKEGSKIIDLSVIDEIPQRGIDIINNAIIGYNEAAVEDINSMGEKTIDFIDTRIGILTGQLSDVEKDVQGYKEKEGIPIDATSNLGVVYEQIFSYSKELDALEIKREILNYLSEYINDPSNQYNLVPSNLEFGNQTLANLVLSLNKAIQERDRLLQIVTPSYPGIKVLEEEINTYQFNIKENIKNIIRDTEIAKKRLNSRSKQLERQLQKTPRRERELLNIKREQFIKENLFLFLLKKREETAIALSATTPPARLVDPPALISSSPIHPKKMFVFIGSIILGLGLAVVVIALLEFFQDTIQSEDEIRNATDVPLLGFIPFSEKANRIVVQLKSRSAVAEMFRLLRTNLQFTLGGKKDQIILFTSSTSGEGKTFMCMNLGMSFALSGKKVLMIGLDLRKPKLATYLNSGLSDKGISNYLIGEASYDEVIKDTGIHPSLHFIDAGPVPPNPSELILNGRLDELILRAKEEYDVVLIDSPPVGLVADSLLIGKLVTSTIFVFNQGVTKKIQLKYIDQLYKEKRFPNLGIVVNGVKRGSGYGYGGGYGYGYGGGYGYYEE